MSELSKYDISLIKALLKSRAETIQSDIAMYTSFIADENDKSDLWKCDFGTLIHLLNEQTKRDTIKRNKRISKYFTYIS